MHSWMKNLARKPTAINERVLFSLFLGTELFSKHFGNPQQCRFCAKGTVVSLFALMVNCGACLLISLARLGCLQLTRRNRGKFGNVPCFLLPWMKGWYSFLFKSPFCTWSSMKDSLLEGFLSPCRLHLLQDTVGCIRGVSLLKTPISFQHRCDGALKV